PARSRPLKSGWSGGVFSAAAAQARTREKNATQEAGRGFMACNRWVTFRGRRQAFSIARPRRPRREADRRRPRERGGRIPRVYVDWSERPAAAYSRRCSSAARGERPARTTPPGGTTLPQSKPMPTIPASVHRPSCRRFARLVIAVAAAAVALAAEPSPSAATGSGAIEGRVFNPATGEYLEFAKISVVETSLETLTDASGEYRLANVPAGEAQVKAFRTGLSEQTATVLVAAGAVARHDFNLAETAPHEGAAIKLDQFVVAS